MTTNAIKKMAAAIAFAMSLGCDRDGTDLLPQPDSSLDRVIEIGEVEVISKSQIEGLAERSNPRNGVPMKTVICSVVITANFVLNLPREVVRR